MIIFAPTLSCILLMWKPRHFHLFLNDRAGWTTRFPVLPGLCVCYKLNCFSHVWLFATLDPMDHSLPGSSDCRILQARILKWVASFRGSSRPKDRTCLLCLLHWQVASLPLAPSGKPATRTSFLQTALLIYNLYTRACSFKTKIWYFKKGWIYNGCFKLSSSKPEEICICSFFFFLNLARNINFTEAFNFSKMSFPSFYW